MAEPQSTDRWEKQPITRGDVATCAVGWLIAQLVIFAIELAWRLWNG